MMKRLLLPLCTLFVLSACKKDEIPPVVEIMGNNPDTVYVKIYSQYPDAGAKATDGEDGEVAVIVTGSVDMNVPGHYVIRYSAQDDNNNFATEVERHVEVIRAQGDYASTENCSSSGANNYTTTASSNSANDTISLTGFPISGYVTRAVVREGGYRIYNQTVSPVMDIEGTIDCNGSTMEVSYTRTDLQGPGASETCTATLKK